jgi:Protein of unknown function (DUF3108)
MARLGIWLSAGLLGAAVAASPAVAADRIAVSYDVSLGGSRIMKASYAVDIQEQAYTSVLEAKTTGVSKLFSKIKLNLTASGSVTDDAVLPKRYDYFRKKNDKLKKRNLSFEGSGQLITQGTDYDAAILKAVGKTVMDPLSMLLKLSRSESPCSGKHRAFDGRDVFDIKLNGSAKQESGITCTMIYTPIAGGDVEDGDTEPQTYEITLLRLENGKGFVPVRITGSTKGVGFEVHARSVSLNGAELSY